MTNAGGGALRVTTASDHNPLHGYQSNGALGVKTPALVLVAKMA